ncbi:MAG: 3-dehydroquinate synthase [Pseudobutyrivibrio sp.]|nr:3-dehydroquinate synthase [Pseudobutyrivibrio sp.]
MAKDLLVNYQGKPSYTIYIREDFNDLASCFRRDIDHSYDSICLVTDSNVAPLYLKELLDIFKGLCDNVSSISFSAGEQSKNLDTVQLVYKHLINKKCTRNSLLVALGGGVVGDLTGFTAATYLRGIDFMQIPTTLLSQVDSSIGGKTGVDLDRYKNMVGAFYMPKMVYMNLATLNSLDDYNFACGMGEVVKYGLISDEPFFEWLKVNHNKLNSKSPEALEYSVYESCKNKKYFVEEDPKEKGIRSYLNFGHTLGHAIEKLSDFSLGHGQCVALGMVAASHLSFDLGKIDGKELEDIINLLGLYNLPTRLEIEMNPEDILAASKSDKKMQGSKIKFIILDEIGKADSYMDFSDQDLLKAIKGLLN